MKKHEIHKFIHQGVLMSEALLLTALLLVTVFSIPSYGDCYDSTACTYTEPCAPVLNAQGQPSGTFEACKPTYPTLGDPDCNGYHPSTTHLCTEKMSGQSPNHCDNDDGPGCGANPGDTLDTSNDCSPGNGF